MEHAQDCDAGNLAKICPPGSLGFLPWMREAGSGQGSAHRRLPGVLNGVLINFLQFVGLELGEGAWGVGALPSDPCDSFQIQGGAERGPQHLQEVLTIWEWGDFLAPSFEDVSLAQGDRNMPIFSSPGIETQVGKTLNHHLALAL